MKAQDDNIEEVLNRLSLKECKHLLSGLRSDYKNGIYVRTKKDELIGRIKAIDLHIKRRHAAIEVMYNNSNIGNYEMNKAYFDNTEIRQTLENIRKIALKFLPKWIR